MLNTVQYCFEFLVLQSMYFLTKINIRGHLGDSVVEHLTLAQGVIPGPGIESHIGLPTGSLLLPLPASVSLCVSYE